MTHRRLLTVGCALAAILLFGHLTASPAKIPPSAHRELKATPSDPLQALLTSIGFFRPSVALPEFPVFEGSDSYNSGTAGTSHNVPLPTGVQAGDQLLVLVVAGGSGTSFGFPAGWTKLFQSNVQQTFAAGWKVADGTEGSTVTITSGSTTIAAQSFRVSKAHGTVPPEFKLGSDVTGSNPNPPALTPAWGSGKYLWLAACCREATSAVTGYPASYSTNQLNTIGSSVSLASAFRELEGSSEDPGTFTAVSANNVPVTFAFVPVHVVPTGFPLISGSATTSLSDTATPTINLPGCKSGDLLLAIVSNRSAASFLFPAGWSHMGCNMNAGQAHGMAWRRADGSEGSTIGLTINGSGGATSRWAVIVLCIRGAHATALPEIGMFYAGSVTHDSPSLTPSWGSAKNLWISVLQRNSTAAPTAYPTNYNHAQIHMNDNEGSSSSCGVSTAARYLEAATEDPGAYTLPSTNVGLCYTIAIAPTTVTPGCTITEQVMTAIQSANTSHTINLPAVVSGDLLVMHCLTSAGVTFTTPTGWSQRWHIAGASNTLACYWRFATGSEGSTVNLVTSSSVSPLVLVQKIKGAENGVDPEAGTAVAGTGINNPNPPSVTPSWGSMKNLYIVAMATANGANGTRTWPTGYQQPLFNMPVADANRTMAVCGRQLLSSSDDPAAFLTNTTANCNVNTLVIKPAA